MKTKTIKERLVQQIEHYAYKARVLEEIYELGFDSDMKKRDCSEARGKAWGQMDILCFIEGDFDNGEAAYKKGLEMAIEDIQRNNYYIADLLELAGYDGYSDYILKKVEEFYESKLG